MKILCGFLVAGACLGACVPDPASYAHARKAYYAAGDGDASNVDTAVKEFAQLHEQCASDPQVLAYWGSLELLQASRTWALWRKYSLSKAGIQAMDDAVKAVSDDLEIRFVRAVTTYSLPEFFHRKEQSEQDFQFLAERAERAVQSGRLDPKLAAASLYFHAEFLHQHSDDKDAVQNWTRAIRVDPQSRAARDAANELKKLQ